MPQWVSQSPGSGWLLGLGLAVVVIAVIVFLRRQQRSGTARDRAEVLAQSADAEHEGAQTRHEGGA